MNDPNPAPTALPKPLSAPFQVGEWLAEPAWNRIGKEGRRVKLEPRVMRLLATLAAVPNTPVLRQDLLDIVWPDMLVNEEALSRAISQLRRAFDDDTRKPRYIQTIHKSGYSLIAPIGVASGRVVDESSLRSLDAGSRNYTRNVATGLLLLAFCAAAAFFYQTAGPKHSAERFWALNPLTTGPGREIDPAISPDGKRVAYIASVDAGFDLFLLNLADGPPARLTASALVKGHPAWSPTGRDLAFVGADGGKAAIYLLSLADRKASKLIDLPSWSFGLDWSPDGRTLAYSDGAAGEKPNIVLLDIASKAMRGIAEDATSMGDVKPVFSPDGKHIAFLRNNPLDLQRIVVADLASGDVRVLDMRPRQIRGLDWQPNGRALIFSARAGRKFGLSRLPTRTGAVVEAMPTEGDDLFNPSISATGRMILEEVEQDRDIWSVDVRSGRTRPLIRSTLDDYSPAFSPDGTRVAFVSERSGSPEIWIASAAGLKPVRLTDVDGGRISQPSWSKDGRRLAFAVDENGFGALYVADVRRGKPTRVPGAGDLVPVGWSAANELFILATDGGRGRLERLNIGTGKRVLLSSRNIDIATAAHDGLRVFAVARNETKILVIAWNGKLLRQFRLPDHFSNLVAIRAARGQLYLFQDILGTDTIHRLNLVDGSISAAFRLGHFRGGSLSLAPDESSLAYTRSRETGNDLSWISGL